MSSIRNTSPITEHEDHFSDEDGNKNFFSYFGSKERARTAIESLLNCKNCRDCSRCSRCFDCSNCSNCSNCSDCSRCSDCSDCSRCFDCSDCSNCSNCSDCSNCSNCSDCSNCSNCSNCSRCFDCFDCSDCSRCFDCFDCSDCSDCSRCFDCSDCSDIENAQSVTIDRASIWSASVPELNKKVWESIQGECALDMSTWHTCETTHCWAGWICTLAGPAGKALERQTSPEFAAMKIYHNSTGERISPVNFYLGNEEAKAKIKELAGV